MKNCPLLTRPEELEKLAARLLDSEIVALDTEFLWERTYYPILGLIQAAVSEDECWLIDTVEIDDLSPLAPVLASPGIVKILHDAHQDLTILSREIGAKPRNVFDTRQSAGFCGLPSTLSLQALAHDVIGVELAKTETRSNWIRRPLTPEQLLYGAEDVIYLPALREQLIARCKDDEVRAWQQEENGRYDDPRLYEDASPYEAIRKVKGRRRNSPREEARLIELAAWRELDARERDLPRRRVLEDADLINLSHYAPDSVKRFYSVPGMKPHVPTPIAEACVNAIRRGNAVPDADLPRHVRTDPEQKRLLKTKSDAFLAALPGRCEPRAIDPALVAARHDAEDFLKGEENRLEKGWRAALLGDLVARR